MGRAIAPLVALLLVAACGDGETRTVFLERVAPSIDPACGAPPDARNLIVTARGDFPPGAAAESIQIKEGAVDIDLFPQNTRVLEVQVLGSGGEERTVGRTGLLDFDALEDDAVISIFMAPRRAFCPVDEMTAARIRPLAARAGGGVLVAGGVDAAGAAVPGVEWYDPARGRFVAVDGSFYDDGLVGATMTELADGRVLVAGGPQTAFQLYDPDTREIAQPSFLASARAHHAAVELSDGRVLLAGGCADLAADGSCDFSSALIDSVILDVDDGAVVPGPSLAVARAGAGAVLEADGRVLLSGGVDVAGEPVAQAERIDPTGGAGQGISEVTGRPVPLASGALLAAFADGLPSAQVFAVAPEAATASRLDDAPAPRVDASITALDDGAVLVLGGAGTGAQVSLYSPARGQFDGLESAPFDLRAHAAVRLDDGAVLVLGGSDDAGDASARAWIFRHDLTGAFTPEFSLSGQLAELLSPRDPRRVERTLSPSKYVLEGSAGPAPLPSEWLVAGGPRFLDAHVTAGARAQGGGLAVFVGFEDAQTYHYVALEGGQPARLWRVRDGVREQTGCSGEPIDGARLSASDPVPTIELGIDSGELQASLDGEVVLSCALDDPIPRGLIGVGVIGDAEATVELLRLVGRR